MSDLITINVWVKTDYVGSEDEATFEIEREDWEALDERGKEEACLDVVLFMVDWGYKVEDNE
jgi:hypothetical protein